MLMMRLLLCVRALHAPWRLVAPPAAPGSSTHRSAGPEGGRRRHPPLPPAWWWCCWLRAGCRALLYATAF